MRFLLAFSLGLFSTVLVAQEILFSDPVRLDEQVNSESEEVNALLSRDGNTLYFVRAFHEMNKGGKGAGMDIWMANKDASGKFVFSANKKNWNNKLNNAVIGIRKDNQVVYLLNSYSTKGGIAFSKNLSGEWTKPEVINMPGIAQLNLVGFYMNSTFSILLISMERSDSFGKEDLYVSLKDSLDKWSEPINLGQTINTSGFEISPFLSEDGKRLYFSSDGHKGYGDGDIWVSERLHSNWTLWSRPKNLGSKINSERFDAYFSVYGDSVCYFSSNRTSSFSDIYRSKVHVGKRTLLQDSVNRIVNETKKLLNELKATDEPDAFEYVASPLNSVILSNPMQMNIKKLVSAIDIGQLKKIELVCYRLHPDQINNVVDYLVSLGANRQKINQPTLVTSGTTQSGVEIKIFLDAKK
jgi:WD40-like Beta Propeller Repeat